MEEVLEEVIRETLQDIARSGIEVDSDRVLKLLRELIRFRSSKSNDKLVEWINNKIKELGIVKGRDALKIGLALYKRLSEKYGEMEVQIAVTSYVAVVNPMFDAVSCVLRTTASAMLPILVDVSIQDLETEATRIAIEKIERMSLGEQLYLLIVVSMLMEPYLTGLPEASEDTAPCIMYRAMIPISEIPNEYKESVRKKIIVYIARHVAATPT